MIGSLAALVSGHPARLLGHLQLYGDLMSAEAAHAMRQLVRRVAYVVLAIELVACGVILAGVAILVGATFEGAGEHWVFWVVPVIPLLGALLAWLKLREETAPAPFVTLRRQVAADAELLANRERSEERERER